MMDVWKNYVGKKVYIETKSGRVYSGKVIDVVKNPLKFFWIIIIDKFDNQINLLDSEICLIQEEKEREE